MPAISYTTLYQIWIFVTAEHHFFVRSQREASESIFTAQAFKEVILGFFKNITRVDTTAMEKRKRQNQNPLPALCKHSCNTKHSNYRFNS